MANNHLMAGAHNLPQMTSATHSHTLYDGAGQGMGYINPINTAGSYNHVFGQAPPDKYETAVARGKLFPPVQILPPFQAEKQQMAASRRLVKVIIVDPDEKVPLDDCVLYSGTEELTDLTDQELFFEIDIKSILDAHNLVRVKIIDKAVKERTEYLEPIKVRDLRMVVVTVAQF